VRRHHLLRRPSRRRCNRARRPRRPLLRVPSWRRSPGRCSGDRRCRRRRGWGRRGRSRCRRSDRGDWRRGDRLRLVDVCADDFAGGGGGDLARDVARRCWHRHHDSRPFGRFEPVAPESLRDAPQKERATEQVRELLAQRAAEPVNARPHRRGGHPLLLRDGLELDPLMLEDHPEQRLFRPFAERVEHPRDRLSDLEARREREALVQVGAVGLASRELARALVGSSRPQCGGRPLRASRGSPPMLQDRCRSRAPRRTRLVRHRGRRPPGPYGGRLR
jgi:hypothetical protein